MKSTFKIEISDEEKKVRELAQSQYHTGGQATNSSGVVIMLEEEDLKEIQEN